MEYSFDQAVVFNCNANNSLFIIMSIITYLY